MAGTFKTLFGWLWPFKGPSAEELAADKLYASAVIDARTPALYTEMEVPDNIDGRFDSIALHMFILLRRMKPVASLDKLSHELIGVFMSDLDRSLREMGVGDLSVGKRVRAMSKAFMGRVDVYDRALDEGEGLADAEVGGEGQEVAGCRSRLRRGSNGHLKVYANPWFSALTC